MKQNVSVDGWNLLFYGFQIYSSAEKCLTALSIRLGESDFFFGSHPTSLDAVVYSYLAPLVKAPFPSNVLQNHAKACTNLLKFVNRITNRYFHHDIKGTKCKILLFCLFKIVFQHLFKEKIVASIIMYKFLIATFVVDNYNINF